jgi:DNA processing protein
LTCAEAPAKEDASMKAKKPNPLRQCRCVRAGEPDYPPEFALLKHAPAEIYICGKLPPPPRVALIGSRHADGYGLDMAGKLALALAREGVAVVNGGAAGVDTRALEAALEAGAPVAAVLGTGCDRSYPAANRRLFDRVAERGALLSELSPGSDTLPAYFSARNRLVSALCEAVVVVRAAEKSGTMVTARYAVEQGKKLMAVPGPAGAELSLGCHRLLRAGALLVDSAGDILKAIGRGPRERSLQLFEADPERELEADELQIWRALCGEAVTVDQLAERCRMDSAAASALLLQLELKGWVERRPGMVYLACSPRPAGVSGGKG